MAFIRATWISTKSEISINVDQIVAVTVIGDNTVIQTSVPMERGPYGIYVIESFNDITSRIANALAYGPGK